MVWSEDAVLLSVSKRGDAALQIDALSARSGLIEFGVALDGDAPPPVLLPGCTMSLSAPEAPLNASSEVSIAQIVGGILASDGKDISFPVLHTVRALVRALVARGPAREIYGATQALIAELSGESGRWPVQYALWETTLLKMLGHISGFERCRADAREGETIYFSPHSGKLVSRVEAGAFLDKMLPVPGFLLGSRQINIIDVRQAMALNDHLFLNKVVSTGEIAALPASRGVVVKALAKVQDIPREPLHKLPVIDETARRRRLLSLRPLLVGSENAH